MTYWESAEKVYFYITLVAQEFCLCCGLMSNGVASWFERWGFTFSCIRDSTPHLGEEKQRLLEEEEVGQSLEVHSGCVSHSLMVLLGFYP